MQCVIGVVCRSPPATSPAAQWQDIQTNFSADDYSSRISMLEDMMPTHTWGKAVADEKAPGAQTALRVRVRRMLCDPLLCDPLLC